MKRALLSILIIHLAVFSFAANYYVSNSGNDTNSGLTTSLPWKTLEKVNAATFKAGDQILFQKGDTFYGTINIHQSGTSGNRITYGAYGSGANPIITGFTTVTEWTDLGGNIWESTNAVSTLATCNMVVINGINTAMGRTPNTANYYTFQSHTDRVSITSSDLTGTPDWTGAEVVVRAGHYKFDRRRITSQSTSTLNWSTNTSAALEDNYGFFIQNDQRTLDAQNEWYYNPISHKISIYSTSQPTEVKIASVENLMTMTVYKSYLTIENIDFIGANNIAILGAVGEFVKEITIQNCSFSYLGVNGVFGLNCTDFLFQKNTIRESNSNAITCAGSLNSPTYRVNVIDNTIENIGILEGMTSTSWHSAIAINKSTNVERNSITNVGFNGIVFYGDSINIINNFIDTFCTVLDDGAAIYTYTGKGTQIDNIKIDGNVCINGIGNSSTTYGTFKACAAGIYLDEATNGVEISNNSIANTLYSGIKLSANTNINVHDNIVFNSYDYQITINAWSPTNGIVLNSNQFITKTESQRCLWISSGTVDIKQKYSGNNNVFASPLGVEELIYVQQPTSKNLNTLEQWKVLCGYDANSQKSSQTITSENDLQFEYNATQSPKTISLSRPMLDVKGTKYATSVTLQPFTSVVLMKDNNPATVPGAPTSVTATAGNTSALVSFVAPVNNGGSAITGYTVTSIPAGGIDSNAGSTSLTHTITGLTNGTSYTFTVKATNSVGVSVASAASNSVIPKAPAATAFTFTGPTSGNVNSSSANFTVTPNNLYTGTITLTPSGFGSAGLSAIVLTFSNSSAAQTFTITPTVSGSITFTPSNNGTLTNPSYLTYSAVPTVPAAPASVFATAGDASASVVFEAPKNNGGSAITGYTVTSVPAGGIDENAGSTSLTHTISGLTNDISYNFTVTATNSAGNSVPSVSSNSVVPITENVITKQAEILPTHFIPVWQGENGLNHMNIMVVSAVLEDLPLNANDEIAVFDGAICVGSMKLSVPINSADNTTFLTIPASQNDGTNNGFNEQDTILFKIWDDLNQTEMLVKAIKYRNDLSSWITTGKFAAGSTSVVELVSFVESFQSIELVKGYNLISTYVAPLNSDASVVTRELSETGSLIKIQDEAGKSLEDWGSYGGWINQLGTIQNTEGYKIKVANNCILQVTGRPIALPLDIPLKTGWNIISFPRTDQIDALSVVQSLIDQNVLVKVQDELGNSVENWGIFGGWKNSIGFFMPGKAYKVKLSADAILTIQENYIKSALILARTEKTEYFISDKVGNGNDHMNINVVGLRESGISVGDELAAFDGTICVGTLKITEDHFVDGTAALVASFSSDEQNLDGFTEGHPIQLLAWNKVSGNEHHVVPDVLNGQALFAKNTSVLIRLKSINTEVSSFNDRMKIDVFPNPCSGKFTVRFSNLPDAGSKLDILDISGRIILSRMITDINEEFNLNNYSSGIYLVKSVINSKETIQKLIVN